MKQFFNKYWIWLILAMFALVPFLWFQGRWGSLINGVDTNFPLNPVMWLQRRFYVWNSVGNAGADFSASTAGLFFHSIQTIPYIIGYLLYQVELISFVFWFGLIVFSSYVFARVLVPSNKLVQLLVVCLYTFNTYIFNTWENVKVANLALAVGIPLSLVLLLNLFDKKISKVTGFWLALLVGIVVSGAGINPAYLVCLFACIFLMYVAKLVTNKFGKVWEYGQAVLIIYIGIVLINLYWLIPSLNYILFIVPSAGSLQGIGFTNWVDSLSQNTSLMNVMRLQGAWDWYVVDSVTKEHIYIPYALRYFNDPVFISFSFLLPTLALLSFLFADKKKSYLYIFSAFVIVIGVFLGAGTHEPTGSLFTWMVKHVPFFSLFRSPWYIFTNLVIIGYVTLIGLLAENFKLLPKKLMNLAIILLIIGNLVYCYPLVSGRIFRPKRGDTFFVNFPGYIMEASNWLNINKDEGRLIGYPDDELEVFNWGYRGVESILELSTDTEVYYSSLNAQGFPVAEMLKEFYVLLKQNNMDGITKVAKKLNANMLFVKQDQPSLSPDISENIANFPKTTFDKWDFYDLSSDVKTKKIYSTSKIYSIFPQNKMPKVASLVDADEDIVFSKDTVASEVVRILESGQIIVAENNLEKNYLQNKVDTEDTLSEQVGYSFEILESGNYTLHLEAKEIDGFILTNATLNNEQLKENYSKVGNYYVFPDKYFEVGKYILEFDTPPGEVLVDGELNMLNTTNSQNDEDVEIQIDPFSLYFIDLQVKHVHGAAPNVVVTQGGGRVFKVQEESITDYKEWAKYGFYFDPADIPSTLTLSFRAKPADQGETRVSYKDVNIRRVFTNDLFLVKTGVEKQNLNSVDYKKVSPVKYEGDIKSASEPFVLIFSENFSPNWELKIKDQHGKRLPANIKHFTVNHYANGYYIGGVSQSEYKFELYYKPQKLYLAGVLVSGLVFIFSNGMLIRSKYYERKHKAGN